MLQIREDYVVKHEDGRLYRAGDTPWYEPFTDNLGQLFKFLQREYGRCVSRVYQDTPDGTLDPIGWVFQKKREYEKGGRFYVQQTWVTHRQSV